MKHLLWIPLKAYSLEVKAVAASIFFSPMNTAGGHCYLIEEEYFDGLAILENLIHPRRARASNVTFELRPLISKLHQADVALNFYD